jgi:hypothetical protein
VNLTELHLTAYGYEILRAMGMQLETDSEGLNAIESTFVSLGYKFKTAQEPARGVKMSDELREAILWIVENRNRRWSEITDRPRPLR